MAFEGELQLQSGRKDPIIIHYDLPKKYNEKNMALLNQDMNVNFAHIQKLVSV